MRRCVLSAGVLVALVLANCHCGRDTALNRGQKDTALMAAVTVGDLAEVRRLLDLGALVGTRDLQGMTVLHVAAFQGREAIAETLIQGGADINWEDRSGYRPLHLAAEQGHTDVCILLIGKGADVNARSALGRTPLDMAEINGRDAAAEALRARGGKPGKKRSSESGSHDEPPRADDAPALVEDVKPKAEWGTIADPRAIEVRKPLMAPNANVPQLPINAEPLQGGVPLAGGPTAQHLLLMNRTPAIRMAEGAMPLQGAAAESYQQIAELLMHRGANLNGLGIRGYTPLHRAAERGDQALAELLVRNGANVNARTRDGKTPLDLAVEKGHDAMVELLHKHGGRSRLELE